MRLTVLGQYVRGITHHDKVEGARLLASLDRIKWLLWHGNQPELRLSLDLFGCKREGRFAGSESVGNQAGEDMDHGVNRGSVA